jgi:hypothetical protein
MRKYETRDAKKAYEKIPRQFRFAPRMDRRWVKTYRTSGVHILSEDNPLRLDDEKVDELFHIIEEALEGGLGDGEVLLRSELARETTAEYQLACNFGGSCCSQRQINSLEQISDDVEVSCGEDEGNGDGEGDCGRAGVFPAEEPVEQAVVVGQGLASGRWLFWSCAGIGKVSEFALGLRSLCFHVLSDRSWTVLTLSWR